MGRPFVLTTVLAALALGGCGGSNKHSSAAGRAGGPAGSASLSTRNISGLGTVLVNGQGETLYAFAPDKGKMVTCTGQCASVWPPLKANGGQKPALSGAVKPSLVSSLPDPSGGRVVTYAGWPLYTYVADAAPGTASGQGLNSSGGAWYVMSPSGTTLKKKFSGSNGPTGYCLAISTRIGTPADRSRWTRSSRA